MRNNSINAAFSAERSARIAGNQRDERLIQATKQFMHCSIAARYSYNFDWLGRPIIQYPQDIVAMQEIIWRVQPDLIIETGIAHGGSLIMSASMLALLDYCEALENNQVLDPRQPKRKVLGIDIDIRPHNRAAIESHPMANRIQMIQGSSIASEVVAEVHDCAAKFKRILVCLDSNHTHSHVLEELRAYAPLVSSGSYCVVFDTIVEDLAPELIVDRPWRQGDNPKTAVFEFLKENNQFEIDTQIDSQLGISVAPSGFLIRK